jgi:hypothetical protein
MREKSEDILHSSAYAKAQNSGNMGATSVESFKARMMMEQNRKNIRGYGNSRIANSAIGNAPRAKTFDGGIKENSVNINSAIKPMSPPVRKNPGISR